MVVGGASFHKLGCGFQYQSTRCSAGFESFTGRASGSMSKAAVLLESENVVAGDLPKRCRTEARQI